VHLQESAVREGRQIGSRPTNSGGVLVVGGSGAAGSKEGELNTAANCDFRSGEAVAMCGWDNLANSTVLRFSHFYPRNVVSFFSWNWIVKKIFFAKKRCANVLSLIYAFATILANVSLFFFVFSL
jgi:hypothetical protein